MKIKVAVLSVGAVVALLLLLHYFALSRAGLPLGWMLYLGLPITAAGVVFALRLVNLGAGWDTKDAASGQEALLQAVPPAEASVSERLQELEALHDEGAISETEYIARRIRIISSRCDHRGHRGR